MLAAARTAGEYDSTAVLRRASNAEIAEAVGARDLLRESFGAAPDTRESETARTSDLSIALGESRASAQASVGVKCAAGCGFFGSREVDGAFYCSSCKALTGEAAKHARAEQQRQLASQKAALAVGSTARGADADAAADASRERRSSRVALAEPRDDGDAVVLGTGERWSRERLQSTVTKLSLSPLNAKYCRGSRECYSFGRLNGRGCRFQMRCTFVHHPDARVALRWVRLAGDRAAEAMVRRVAGADDWRCKKCRRVNKSHQIHCVECKAKGPSLLEDATPELLASLLQRIDASRGRAERSRSPDKDAAADNKAAVSGKERAEDVNRSSDNSEPGGAKRLPALCQSPNGEAYSVPGETTAGLLAESLEERSKVWIITRALLSSKGKTTTVALLGESVIRDQKKRLADICKFLLSIYCFVLILI